MSLQLLGVGKIIPEMQLIKRPFYIFLVLSACTAINSHNPELTDKTSLEEQQILNETYLDLWERVRVGLTVKLPDDFSEAERYRKRYKDGVF